MYKAARDVHTNGIHNTFTSKGRGKMNHIKQFFREKGLYLFCLAMVLQPPRRAFWRCARLSATWPT